MSTGQSSTAERRNHPRRKTFQSQKGLQIKFQESGTTVEIAANVRDISESGLGLETNRPIAIGAKVAVSGELLTGIHKRELAARSATVISCGMIQHGVYATGVLFDTGKQGWSADSNQPRAGNDKLIPDHYETMQLSPKAEPETIHRVYRILAQRYHPDNLETGNQQQFQTLLEAYLALSDPERRAAYDAGRELRQHARWKVFNGAEAVIGRAAEKRKRQGILSLLYTARLNQPNQPGVVIQELEDLLGCPREHLEFSLWYLKENGCLIRGDNGRYSITMKGIDRAEEDEPLPGAKLLAAPE